MQNSFQHKCTNELSQNGRTKSGEPVRNADKNICPQNAADNAPPIFSGIVEQLEADRGHDKQIRGGNSRRMVAQKGRVHSQNLIRTEPLAISALHE
jgi:hypothetical protein